MTSSNASTQAKYLRWLPWLFTVSFVLITFLPRSIDDTMFMDGVTYASIARNMSEGQGSFWRPFFAHSFWLPYDNGAYFSGHPPLQFGLQSLLFKLMGDTTAVENTYNLLILIGNLLLIAGMWSQMLGKGNRYRAFGWLPVLCWYGMSIVWYSMPNNFLDSTMGLFCLGSCYFQLRFLKKEASHPRDYIWLVFAGLSVFLALLTKGPVGLYPLAFPMIYAVANAPGEYRKGLRMVSVMSVIVLAGLAGLLVYTPAREFLTTYFNGQVVQALLQKREKAGTGWAAHFTLVAELARTVYPHVAALAALHLVTRLAKVHVSRDALIVKNSVLVALAAASGIVPMLVSIKQYPHYLLPALPFVALLFAFLFVQRLVMLMDRRMRLTTIALTLGCLGCWALTFQKLTTADSDVHAANARRLRTLVPVASTLGICHDLYQHADIHANFQRYHHLSLSTRMDTARYILADSTCLPQFDLTHDSAVRLQGAYWLIIRKR